MVRSPNYPSLPLGEAIEAIRSAYKQEHRSKMAQKVLAKHLGYGSLSGRALAKIGAIRAYGLVEGSGDELRISEDAVTLLTAPKGRPELQEAKKRCGLRPTLFADLRSENPGQLPSIDNLRFAVIQRGFTEKAAEKAAENFLATMRFIGESKEDYGSSESAEEGKPTEQEAPYNFDRDEVPPPPTVPFKVELYGDRLRVVADVDRKGLKKLMKVLEAQKPFLEPEENDDGA